MPLAIACDAPPLPPGGAEIAGGSIAWDQAHVPMKPPHVLRPGNRYARENGGRTLGDLMKAKMALVAACRRCKHRRVLYPANLIPRFGETCPAIELRGRLRCNNCRGQMANLHESAR
jgi:hypothetical protein